MKELNENQKRMISASKMYAGSNCGLYKEMSNAPADLDGFELYYFPFIVKHLKGSQSLPSYTRKTK